MNLAKPLIAVVFASFCIVACAQDNPAPTVSVSLPATAKAGATVKGTLTMTFADGLHGYQNPPSDPDLIPVKIDIATKGVKLKKVEYPTGKSEAVGGESTPVKVYEGTIKIPVLVTLPKTHGALKIKFDASYQQCNANSCFPPSDVFATATIKVK